MPDRDKETLLVHVYNAAAATAKAIGAQAADREDLASAAVVAVLSRWEDLERRPQFPSFLSAYAGAVVRNAWRRMQIHRRRLQPVDVAEVSDEVHASLPDLLVADEERVRVEASVGRLDPSSREVLVAAMADSLDEYALRSKISPEAARVRLYRAVTRLRSMLGRPP